MQSRRTQETRDAVALVTGAGRGIGRAVAIQLARAGFALSIAARSSDELHETRSLTGLDPERALIVLVDLALNDAPQQLFDATVQRYGRLDVLVNNAGWAPARTRLIKLSPEEQDRVLLVNLRAPIALTRLAAGQMAKQEDGGVIVSIASAAARHPAAGETVYAAAKAGLIAFTHACFAELREHRIRTSVIVPGLVDTALIPHNRQLERALMLSAADVAAAVLSVVNAAKGVCPVELVLEPQRDPMRARR